MEISFVFVITLLVVALATVGAFKFSTGKVGKSGQVSMLAVGEAAPDFELKNFQGKSFKLSSFKGKQPVVVFFYPADSTPGCTKEVSLQLPPLTKLNAVDSHRLASFKENLQSLKRLARRSLVFPPEGRLTKKSSFKIMD